VDNDGEAEWYLTSRQPSQLSEIISSGELKEQEGQDEVNGGQKQLRDREEMEMSDNDFDAVSETHKLPNTGNDLLTLRRLMSHIYMEHPFLMFLDHTQRRSTVGRTPLDE